MVTGNNLSRFWGVWSWFSKYARKKYLKGYRVYSVIHVTRGKYYMLKNFYEILLKYVMLFMLLVGSITS